jgi:hypothetical protein
LLGGTGVTATGCWLALRRVRNDIVMLFRWRGKSSIADANVPSVQSGLPGGSS